MPEGIEYTKLYLVPKITSPKLSQYPFSYQFVAHCLHYCLIQNESKNEDEKQESVRSLLSALRKQSDKKVLEDYSLDDYFKMPLTNEDAKLSEEYKVLLDKVIYQDNENDLREIIKMNKEKNYDFCRV